MTYAEFLDYIDPKIKDAIKSKSLDLVSLRSIKSDIEYQNEKAKGAKPIEDIVKAQVKQRKGSLEVYQKKGRQDLIDSMSAEIGILEALLPAPAISESDVLEFLGTTGIAKEKKNFRLFRDAVVAKFGEAPESSIIAKYISSED